MNLGQRVEIPATVVGIHINGELRLQLGNGQSLVTQSINVSSAPTPESDKKKAKKDEDR